MKKNIGIIGAGLIGLSLGCKLSQINGYNVTIFEKEDKIGKHQSGNNSGVIHCGFGYKPGSLKAKLAKDGAKQLISFSNKNNIDYNICGKLVVANSKQEIKFLEIAANNGLKNGYNYSKILNRDEIKKIEPNIDGLKGLFIDSEGIIDYRAVMIKFKDIILSNGGEIILNSSLKNFTKFNNKIIYNDESVSNNKFDIIINCAGLYSDKVYEYFSDKKSPLKIIPFRGEYWKFKPEYNKLINNLVYPVANPKFPFLGVHFTRMINGEMWIGPNAVLALKREGYSRNQFSLTEFIETLTYSGFQKFILKNYKFSIQQFFTSILKSSFVKKAKPLFADLSTNMIEKAGSGVRAQAISNTGNLIMDFNIQLVDNQIHILNSPSPGATACMSIADFIINEYII